MNRLLIILILALVMSCKTKKQTESVSVAAVDATQVIERADSTRITLDTTTQKETNSHTSTETWSERIYWSAPDEQGRQHITMTERSGKMTAMASTETATTHGNAKVERTERQSDSLARSARIAASKRQHEDKTAMSVMTWESKDWLAVIAAIIILIIVWIIARQKSFP